MAAAAAASAGVSAVLGSKRKDAQVEEKPSKHARPNKEIVTVSIIGTDGNGEDAPKMNAEVYKAMCIEAMCVITKEWKLSPDSVQLVGGGSAWSNHVAVDLFLNSHGAIVDPNSDVKANPVIPFAGLMICLPCQFSMFTDDYVDARAVWLRRLHVEFANKLGRLYPLASFNDMRLARELYNATIVESDSHEISGFRKRNAQVAQSKYVLSFAWCDDPSQPTRPTSGSAKETWDLAGAREPSAIRKHVSLTALMQPKARGYEAHVEYMKTHMACMDAVVAKPAGPAPAAASGDQPKHETFAPDVAKVKEYLVSAFKLIDDTLDDAKHLKATLESAKLLLANAHSAYAYGRINASN